MSIILRRTLLFCSNLFLVLFMTGCQPPDISAFVLGGKIPEEGRYIQSVSGAIHRFNKFYSFESLNARLQKAHLVEIYDRNLNYVSSLKTKLVGDSLQYENETESRKLSQVEIRQLIIYDDSKFERRLRNSGCLGLAFGGIAPLAYVPPNPSNEPPVSTVFILAGTGAVIGFTLGNFPGDKEVVAFLTENEAPW